MKEDTEVVTDDDLTPGSTGKSSHKDDFITWYFTHVPPWAVPAAFVIAGLVVLLAGKVW